jgi:threonine dehydrogenase-like Zn-dependent dehydrogenase
MQPGGRKSREAAPVLCIGGGPVGLSIAQVARVRGAEKVFVAETSSVAQSILTQFEVIVADSGKIGETLAAHLGRPEVAVIFDSVGTEETFSQALPLLDASGVPFRASI